MMILLFFLGYPALTNTPPVSGAGDPPPGMGDGSGNATTVDLTTMSLEEQGTVLFNRVMASSAAGDTADVSFFLPKALTIYGQLDPSDPDGLYHFALLYQVGGDFETALATAQRGLAEVPDYLLLLAVVAESSAASGDREGARDAYQHFLDVYETEMGLMRPGYEHHQAIFPVYREAAEAFLSQG
jgi:tetratricopeptide (TPR) repeat protein